MDEPKSSPTLNRSKQQILHDSDAEDGHHDDFPGLYLEEDEHKVISESKIDKSDSDPPKNLGAQARISSESRYARFSEYVLRKISSQVLFCAKKGLWRTEIYLAESHWSRDPENQRRLLVTLGKQELSARVFPPRNKKVRILVWWSAEPPTAPSLSKQDSSNEASSNISDKKTSFKKKDLAIGEDSSSSSSADVIETDFKQAKKYDRKIKQGEKKKAEQEKKSQKKKEKDEKKKQKKQIKQDRKQEKKKKTHSETESDDSDFSLDLSDSSDDEKARKLYRKERKTEKLKERIDRKRIDSDEDLVPLSSSKSHSLSRSSKSKHRHSEDADLSDDKQSQKKKGQ